MLRSLLVAAAAMLLGVLAGHGQFAHGAGPIERVSLTSTGGQVAGASSSPRVSEDGRYVVFVSGSPDIVPGDNEGTWDVFLRDRQAGTTVKVSAGLGGAPGNAIISGDLPDISCDGRYVVFESEASNLVAGDTNGARDIFLWDRVSGQMELVSVNSDEEQSNQQSYGPPAVSCDGRFVVFQSNAYNLVPWPTDHNASSDIYLRDRQAQTTELISVDISGDYADGAGTGTLPDISDDGRFVVFRSTSSNMVAGDTNDSMDLFVRDRQESVTFRANLTSAGAQAADIPWYMESYLVGVISANGRYVAFASANADLAPGDTNNQIDVFVRDLRNNTTTRVSVTSEGDQAGMGGGVTPPSINEDGRFIAFDTYSVLTPDDANGDGHDVYVFDQSTGTMTLVSNARILGNPPVGAPAISGNGEVVAFVSESRDHVAGDTNEQEDVFVGANAIRPVSTFEFTQAIQILQTADALKDDLADDGKPPVPIVAKKPAVLRVYPPEVAATTNITIEVRGVVNSSEAMTLEPGCTPDDRRRWNIVAGADCLSANFYFTPPIGPWSATVKVRGAAGGLLERHVFALESKESDALVLKAVSVCDAVGGCGNAGELPRLTDLLASLAPTDDVRVEVTGHQVWLNAAAYDLNHDGTVDDTEGNLWWDALVARIHTLYQLYEAAAPVAGEQSYYFGMVRPEAPGARGGQAAHIPAHGGASRTSTPRLGLEVNYETVAHETGHMLGQRHTNTIVPLPTGGSPPGCYNRAWDEHSDWPYADNLLRSGAAPGVREVGFDVARRAILVPEYNYELMSYCVPRWVSPRTYNGMLSILDPPPSSPPGELGAFWLVSGMLEPAGAMLDPLFTFETLGSSESGSGTHRIEARSPAGTVLFTRLFTPSVPHTETTGPDEEGTPFFAELVPVQAGAARIVVIDDTDAEVGQIALGGTAPTVGITFPAGGETLSGPQTVTWTIGDPDSASHVSYIQYSPDDGVTWLSLASDVDAASLVVDFASLPGSDGTARIRVLSSDGANTGTATSNLFSVTRKLPQATIAFPDDGDVFRPGELVWLRGVGLDGDDGVLAGESMQWSSSRDGQLGSGDDLPLTGMSQGTHIVTLTATDSNGNEATDIITIQIVASPLSETPPTPTPTPTATPASTATPTPMPTPTPTLPPSAVPGTTLPSLVVLGLGMLLVMLLLTWRVRRQHA